jgi:hypothetical protein
MIPPPGGSGLEDRLDLISKMLEEAIDMLRCTMSEVREEAKADHEQPSSRPGPDQWSR